MFLKYEIDLQILSFFVVFFEIYDDIFALNDTDYHHAIVLCEFVISFSIFAYIYCSFIPHN